MESAKNILLDRAAVVDLNFTTRVLAHNFPRVSTPTNLNDAKLSKNLALDIFHSQMESRHLDLIARILRNNNQAFYTIGSSGHEGNAAIAAAFNFNDIALLHYRSGAFMLQRARQYGDDPKIFDHLLAQVASSADPIAMGRHKVFGSAELFVPPQTSTIASHLPKAIGIAFSLSLAKDLLITSYLPNNSVVLCSFGDASANHSSAQGAFNAAGWITAHNLPLPLVFICEDNGIGISVKTQADWIEKNFKHRAHITYIACDGLNFCDVYRAAQQAAYTARIFKKPVVLHMQTVRLLGHAGSDIEFHYHTQEEIEQIEADDPLLHSARILIEAGIFTAKEIVAKYEAIRQQVVNLSKQAITMPKITSKQQLMSSMLPKKNTKQVPQVTFTCKQEKKVSLAEGINLSLHHLLQQYKNIVIFGEDVAKKGGVYRITNNLQKTYGAKRVFDTPLDEQTILGTAIGLAHNGILPIPEIQFLAYIVNAVDQLRGEAATLSFFSSGQFVNPMVIRVPGLAYQRGFGGHFHNDNSISFLREIPGVIIACPCNATEAAGLLRTCVRLAYQESRVVIFLEPIALYRIKDLHVAGDNLWLASYPDIDYNIEFGQPDVYCEGHDFSIITYGNGVLLARQALKRIQEHTAARGTIINLRWLSPLPIAALIKILNPKAPILIVDEGRKTTSISDTLMANLVEANPDFAVISRITGADCFIPLGDAWQFILPGVEDIVHGIQSLLKGK